jgi:hypothetical protein
MTCLAVYELVKSVKIAEVCRVGEDCHGVRTEGLHRAIKLGRATTSHEDECAFRDKPFGCREPDSAAAAGDHCHLVF